MPDGKIEGGYILLSRKIIESEIWRKPPLYLKVWIWLLERAQHKEYKQLKRGQLFASISDIRAGVAWYVGYRKETPTKDQIFQILEWMRNPYGSNMRATMKAPMIATTKATHGMVIEILNYEHYQNPKNYESNNESNDEPAMKTTRKQRQPNNTNKNDKNDKNNKNNIFIPPTLEEVISYCKERNNSVDPQKWYDFYSAKGWMIGKNKMKDWKAAVRTWERGCDSKPQKSKYRDMTNYQPGE